MELSNRIRSVRPLATVAVHGRAEELKAKGHKIIDLAIALSNYPAPAAVVNMVNEGLHASEPLPYTSVYGAAKLRTSLVKKLASENNIEVRPEEIIVTNGAKQAVYEAMYVLTDPGDKVIIFRPYWPAYMAIAELLGLDAVLVDLPDELTKETMDALPRAKAIILNNPHNPTGKVFSAAELECIREWMTATGAHAICDECYEKLIFEGEHISLAAISDWKKLGIVTIFSASQSYGMMGWRVGFAVAPEPVVKAMEALQGPITAAASALTQLAAEAAFSSGTREDMKADYRRRRDVAVKLFDGTSWAKTHSLASGPYLWCDISALTGDTLAFCEGLLNEEKIAIMPGDALGMPGFIRLSIITDSLAVLEQAALGIIRYGEKLMLAKTAMSAH